MDASAKAPIGHVDAGSIADSALSDGATTVDKLGFTPYVEAIARFLTVTATKPPVTISIEGDWGSGKSSFLLMLENAIRGGAPDKTPIAMRLPQWLGGVPGLQRTKLRNDVLTVRFNAWRHDKQDALWAAFALAFVQSLRREVGFWRACWGDIRLFLKRLNGVRAIAQLGLFLVAMLVLAVGVYKLIAVARTDPGELQKMLDWLLKADPVAKPGAPKAPPEGLTSVVRVAKSYGWFGSFVAVGLAGLYKFGRYVRMPLSWKLEKYISKPDYEGHASFIESFHADLNRLIQAYAGKRRVFIFIDDLDRCDVPRAADLMQAINLMIGDSKNLVFVIGMDREKVAAGIAQKYKDILPFLRESAHWKPGDEVDTYTPLYFGYSYLEKFIQISFTLPVAGDESTLNAFLAEEAPLPSMPSWWSRLRDYWTPRMVRDNQSPEDRVVIPAPPSSPRLPTVAQRRRTANRLKMERDSDRIRAIVKLVSPLFEYNPRRIKQFINTFRLSLYIASDQGLFDEEDQGPPPVTPEQIGKCVALLLRFPDLRSALELDGKLLAALQDASLLPLGNVVDGKPRYHWLTKPGATPLLEHRCQPTDSELDIYSLAHFDVTRLFAVLPRVAPQVETADTTLAVFTDLGTRYEAIRETQRAGAARTRQMTDLAREALEAAQRLSPSEQTLDALAADDREGGRLMWILIASVFKSPAHLILLKHYNGSYASPFEHHWCIRTLLGYASLMTGEDRAEINAALEERWEAIEKDPGRISVARQLRDLTATASPSLPREAPKSRNRKAAEDLA